ncbi:MAG TPA: nicotinate-nucleotide adenylyltransferase [Myxococcales bacterium]|nr:nicotinate-nucleotide adenylyltransferase [Myxococcales bacterium]
MRFGLFGGTFDPPHTGHLIAAQDAALALGLDRVLFVPAAVPPHKQHRTITPAEFRLQMLALALSDDTRFTLDPVELERPGPSYTVDTLRELRRRLPGEWTLLLGADQYAEFATWREPEEVLRLATVGVLERAGTLPRSAPSTVPAEARDGVVRVSVTRVDISSTAIRQRVAAGVSIRYLVPHEVETFIAETGLYLRNGTSQTG